MKQPERLSSNIPFVARALFAGLDHALHVQPTTIMSNSMQTSTPCPAHLPTEQAISQCLYGVVRLALKGSGEITTRQAREQAEAQLGLNPGFFKDHATWNPKSKQILQDAVQAPPTPAKPTRPAKPATVNKAATKRKSDGTHPAKKRQKKATVPDTDEDEDDDQHDAENTESIEDESPKPRKKSAANASSKRKSTTAQPKAQSRKKSSIAESDSEEAEESPMMKTKRGSSKAKQSAKISTESSAVVQTSSKEDEDSQDKLPDPRNNGVHSKDVQHAHAEEDTIGLTKDKRDEDGVQSPDVTKGELNANGNDAGDESDYSVVLDKPPAKKGRGRKLSSDATKSKSKKPVRPKADTKDLSPDDEEIKRLQGWLVKCGIRKVWHKELADCLSASQKIKHLKAMLTDAGMTGRYSAEKARSVKEARELADEIQAAQEFNRKWGEKSGDEDEDDMEDGSEDKEESKTSVPPTKRLPKGLVDFGDDDDIDDSE